MLNCFYYNNTGKKFFSKYDAATNLENTKLWYYDHIFRRCNWSIEPYEDLTYLYKLRAQEIRDSYDYLVLAYSGGIDSTTILETFYYNNIHLDEILCVGAFSRDSKQGSDENHNGEIYTNCFETLNDLSLSNTKISIVDYTVNFDTLTLSNQDDWYKKIGSWFSFHHWFWYDLSTRFPVDKKIGIIFGIDKPNLNKVNDKFYFCFKDSSILQYGMTVETYNNPTNVERINYYWAPTASKIIIKQCHTLMNFYKEFVENQRLISENDFNANSVKFSNKLVYNLKHPLKFISPKSPSSILSLRDSYAKKFSDFKDLTIFKNYIQGIERLPPNMQTAICSHPYYLN